MIDEFEVLHADDGGTFDRQEFLRRAAAAGLAVPSISLLFGARDARHNAAVALQTYLRQQTWRSA